MGGMFQTGCLDTQKGIGVDFEVMGGSVDPTDGEPIGIASKSMDTPLHAENRDSKNPSFVKLVACFGLFLYIVTIKYKTT